MRKLLGLYEQTEALLKAKTQEEYRILAGSFRDSYAPAGELTLMGMGDRTFQSPSGYEGEIYYFLETEKGDWYTWTDARPVFYEGRRKPVGNGERQAAPWEMNCSREQMTEMVIRLKNAKAAKGNRLSVSQETKGEILGKRILSDPAFQKKTVWDYRILLEQYFSKPLEEQEETDHLALVGAVRCGECVFDQIEQRFFLPLYDLRGRKISISLRYSKEEKYTIRLLERLQKRLTEREEKVFAFFGRLYLEKGSLVLYPIEFFDGVSVRKEENDEEKEAGANEKEVDGKVLREFMNCLTQADQALADLFQSGLDSVLDENIERIARIGCECEEMGLHFAGKTLKDMQKMLRAKRHRMNFCTEEILHIWAKLVRYLGYCREIIARDSAFLAMEIQDDEF